MITSAYFGTTADGRTVNAWTLTGADGACVRILDYGATIQAICVPDRNGALTDVVLGYDDISGYEAGDMFFGATVGRHANRIGKGCFTLEGVEYHVACNNGPNHLHGGPEGFDCRSFTAEADGDTLRMQLVSPDGDQGYPGELKLTVEFRFDACNALSIHYLAETDKPTVVNLTNHSYFDLSGGQNPEGQLLRLSAGMVSENDPDTLPTGVLLPVDGTVFDFRTEKPLGQDLHTDTPQLTMFRGYDHNFVLDKHEDFAEVAWLRSPETGISMTMSTDTPGMQLYTANWVEADNGKGGRHYTPWSAVAMEAQCFPNGMAIPHFPKPILLPGEAYEQITVYRFSRTEV